MDEQKNAPPLMWEIMQRVPGMADRLEQVQRDGELVDSALLRAGIDTDDPVAIDAWARQHLGGMTGTEFWNALHVSDAATHVKVFQKRIEASELSLGQIISGYRQLNGWTVERLAAKTLLSKQSIIDCEKDRGKPYPENLKAIVETLRIPLEKLLGPLTRR